MSRKTIRKNIFRQRQNLPKFTRWTKHLFKKFTNKTTFFSNLNIKNTVCKQNLPILRPRTGKMSGFCAHFCLFFHLKNGIFCFGKYNLPIREK
jgi:hypothetical protein